MPGKCPKQSENSQLLTVLTTTAQRLSRAGPCPFRLKNRDFTKNRDKSRMFGSVLTERGRIIRYLSPENDQNRENSEKVLILYFSQNDQNVEIPVLNQDQNCTFA